MDRYGSFCSSSAAQPVTTGVAIDVPLLDMYILDDVEKPNVFRNMFPYSEIPKIPFNDRIVPHNMPREIWITDTTFRDGQQSRAPYTTEQIVTIYDYLHKLGGPNGMIRASEFFLYSKKDRDAVYKCMERGYRFPEAWVCMAYMIPCTLLGITAPV